MNVNEALDKIVNGVENNARDIAEVAECIHQLVERIERLESKTLPLLRPSIASDNLK